MELFYNASEVFVLFFDCFQSFPNFIPVYVYRYEKYTTKDNESAYAVTGLITVYEYYAYPNNKRPRISQMLILPTFQNRGLAVHLLNSMYKFYSTDKSVIDITGKSQF